jgi:lipoprotein-releasing system permease protein
VLIQRFKLSLEIAVRFLLSKHRSNFLSFISVVSVIGVCVGVLALLVVTSVVNGFENELTRVIAGTQGDVLFYSRGNPIRDRQEIERKILQFAPEVKSITGSFVSEVMFNGPIGVAGGALEGVDLHTWQEVISVADRLTPGSVLPENEGEIILGSALAERLGVAAQDSVRVILPFTGGGSDESGYGSPRVQDFKVVGIVHLGMYDYDSKYAYAPLASVQNLVLGSDDSSDETPGDHSVNKKDWITSFRMKLKDGRDAQKVALELSQHFGFPYRVRDWSQMNRNLLYAIQLEKAVISVLLTAIMIVAAFNVISALLMMVYEKEEEIAILRVMGVRQRDHFVLFSWLGSFFGLLGTLAGMILGLICVFILNKTHLIQLPAEIYHLEYLPVVVRWTEWCAIGVMAFVICFLATVGPAAQIARRSPVEALKWTR